MPGRKRPITDEPELDAQQEPHKPAQRPQEPPSAPAAPQPPPAATQAPEKARKAAQAPLVDDGPYEASQNGTKWRASAAPRGSGADWDNARQYFTAPSITDWVAKMKAEPAVWQGMLSDIFRETKAERERQAGRAKIGRRPKVIHGSLTELWDMITPKYAKEPFALSLPALLASVDPDIDDDEFCRRTMISAETLAKMRAGTGVDMWRLEVIARTFGVSPAYFLEWRNSYVLTVVDELLKEQPWLSIRYAKALRNAIGGLPTAPKKRRRASTAA